jgi:excisionase family DNA binding protein
MTSASEWERRSADPKASLAERAYARGALAILEAYPMTLTEAATVLGITPDNLRGAIKRGSLQATKHGRDWWVEPAEVERYKRENRRRTS